MKLLRKAMVIAGLLVACAMPAQSAMAYTLVCEGCVIIVTKDGIVIRCERCYVVPPQPAPGPQ